jgi:hypothetical protein
VIGLPEQFVICTDGPLAARKTAANVTIADGSQCGPAADWARRRQ